MGNLALTDFLISAGSSSARSSAVALTIQLLADAAALVAAAVADGASNARFAEEGATNVQGEVQKYLDVFAHNAFLDAARNAPIACLLSEEEELPVSLHHDGALALAIDPLDGSSNIGVNSTIGTIFGIYPVVGGDIASNFLRSGRELVASGYFIYGARTELVVSLGSTPKIFALNVARTHWVFVRDGMIPKSANEFAINMSNYRFWSERERQFVDQCVDGKDGPLSTDYNMRWLAALCGETHRIFARGGIFFYPADRRPSYERGRLRYIYECAPIAFLVENAGGVANDGAVAILDLVPETLHGRCPLCFGSAIQMQLFADAKISGERQYSPLFSKRGFFRSDA